MKILFYPKKLFMLFVFNIIAVFICCYCQLPQLVNAGGQHAAPAPLSSGIPQTFAATSNFKGIYIDRYQPSNRMIGDLTVNGTSYLFPVPVKANIFSVNGTGYNVMCEYDTYEQHLEIFQGDISLGKIMTKNVNDIDSFFLKDISSPDFPDNMFFINARHLGSTKSFFLQQLYKADKFTLYKFYNTVLENTSSDFGVTGIKDFSLKSDYFFTTNNTSNLKKLRLTSNALRKEFPGRADIEPLLRSERLGTDTEKILIEIFAALNSR